MKAMILAAGYGTRLRPLTFSKPKPMVRICNRPLIGYAVEHFIKAGVKEIIVNVHHLPGHIERYLERTYGDQAQFFFSMEPEILGTGGGVRKVRPLLEGEEEFFLVNGDTVQFPKYDELRRARASSDALAALTLRHPPENDRFTPVWFENGHVNGFGKGRGEALMFSGSHLISTRIFQHLPNKEFSGIVDEVYQPLIQQNREKVAAIVDDGPWFDIGTPQRYISAAAEILSMTVRGEIPVVKGSRIMRDSVVDNTSSILGDVKASSVGEGSTINGEVRNSIVGHDCRITESAVLDSCIVGDGVDIRNPLDVKNAVIVREDAEAPHDPTYRYEDGLVIYEF